jgi:hypothetical protein
MDTTLLKKSLMALLEEISSFELFIDSALNEVNQHADASVIRHIASSTCALWEHVVNFHFVEVFHEMEGLSQEYDYHDLASELEACHINWKTLDFIAKRASPKARLIYILERLETMKARIQETKKMLAEHIYIESLTMQEVSVVLASILECFLLDLSISCSQLMLNATAWYREQNPEAAQREDFHEVLSIPLHVKIYGDQRSMPLCLTCKSRLTSDDVTFNGYFCENCRTRWIYEGVTV